VLYGRPRISGQEAARMRELATGRPL